MQNTEDVPESSEATGSSEILDSQIIDSPDRTSHQLTPETPSAKKRDFILTDLPGKKTTKQYVGLIVSVVENEVAVQFFKRIKPSTSMVWVPHNQVTVLPYI
jgi:hypothetical protein